VLLDDLRQNVLLARPARAPTPAPSWAHRAAGAAGLEQAGLLRDLAAGGQVQCGALGAQAAKIGRVIRVTAHAGNLVALLSMMTPQPTPQ
jgi:hypothetical protein